MEVLLGVCFNTVIVINVSSSTNDLRTGYDSNARLNLAQTSCYSATRSNLKLNSRRFNDFRHSFLLCYRVCPTPFYSCLCARGNLCGNLLCTIEPDLRSTVTKARFLRHKINEHHGRPPLYFQWNLLVNKSQNRF